MHLRAKDTSHALDIENVFSLESLDGLYFISHCWEVRIYLDVNLSNMKVLSLLNLSLLSSFSAASMEFKYSLLHLNC